MKEAGGPRTTIEKLISAAVQAGALSAACSEFPESRQGLERAYGWHHRRCDELANEISHTGRLPGRADVGVPNTER